MTCHNCRIECRKFGKRGNRQRYQCHQCRKVFTDARDNTLDGMYLPVENAELVLRLLLEGSSVSSVEGITEVHHTTILKLLVLAGEKCERIMAEKIRAVKVRDVELDEVWSFACHRTAVSDAFEGRCDFAQLIKVYCVLPPRASAGTALRRSPRWR